MFKNKNFLIIALIVVVNALGYGIIIPILYSYSQKFGLNDLQNGLLFALFSLCQFISTPIIGRLSDKFGRKPMLVGSIAGTAISFFMMAWAPNVLFLFLARALDGLTAGNIPVAQAVISDTTTEKDRAKGFGIIGASFGFGFVFGPAISALTVGFSEALPFVIAGVIAVVAVIITVLFLPETNKHIGEVAHKKLFDFSHLYHTLFDPSLGRVMIITLISSFAFACAIIFGYQPFSVKVLHLSPTQISILFTVFGLVGIFTQAVIVPWATKRFGIKHPFRLSFLSLAILLFVMGFSNSFLSFILLSMILGVVNSLIQPLIYTIISKETDAKSQGSVFGLNASYMSVGQIFGPVVGGIIASYSVRYPFFFASIFAFICFLIAIQMFNHPHKKESAF